MIESHPNIWMGCRCPGIRRCADCTHCYEHCLCVTPEARLEALDREEAPIKQSIEEARQLVVALGVEEIYGTLNEDTLWKIEQLLRARYRAFKRFRRRINQQIEISINRQSVERRIATDVITVKSDRPN